MATGAAVRVEVKGLQSLQASLRALPKKVEGKIVRTAMRNGTKVVAKKTAEMAPVDTGLLRRSFAVRGLKRKKGRTGYRVTIKNVDKIAKVGKGGKRSFYPAAVEYGTSKMQPHPFMRPAFEQTVDPVTKQIGDEMGAGIIAAAKVPTGGK